jgi:hypothetical protein
VRTVLAKYYTPSLFSILAFELNDIESKLAVRFKREPIFKLGDSRCDEPDLTMEADYGLFHSIASFDLISDLMLTGLSQMPLPYPNLFRFRSSKKATCPEVCCFDLQVLVKRRYVSTSILFEHPCTLQSTFQDQCDALFSNCLGSTLQDCLHIDVFPHCCFAQAIKNDSLLLVCLLSRSIIESESVSLLSDIITMNGDNAQVHVSLIRKADLISCTSTVERDAVEDLSEFESFFESVHRYCYFNTVTNLISHNVSSYSLVFIV